jgi:uncharacterized protein (DUF305 family)
MIIRRRVREMQNRQVMRARKYLCRYDEIIKEMAEKMLSQEVTNSITINFIETMIPHHQAAICMAENLLQYTTYQPLQEMAKNMIKDQTEGIEQMKEIARTTYGFQNMPQEVNCYQEKYLEITKHMLEKMKNAPRTIYINLDFTYEMISHHEGAIAMCENVLNYRIDPRLKVMADKMIEKQTKEVKDLKEIQKRLSR